MQLTCKENEYLLGKVHIDPQTKNYETRSGFYELNDKKNAFKGKVELKVDEKTTEITLTTQHEIIFTSELNEVFGLYQKEKSCWNTFK